MKRVLVVRYGAFGDMLNITPALKKLKEEGYYVILNTSKRGEEVLRNNPNIDKIVLHDDSVQIEELDKHWTKIKSENPHERYINFSESIECNVALHPINPEYIYPKKERYDRCNRNYYDVSAKWAGLEECKKTPEIFFTKEEEDQALGYIKPEKFNILWVMSGSGKQKVYPWAEYVIGELLKNNNDIHIITVGDLQCQLLETIVDKDITNLSGNIPMRISMALTKFSNLVISPDTGVLHASGCFETPKIGLLGHTTIENITKHFKNDFSIEADCACAPCFRLIYDHLLQCPCDVVTGAAWCMAMGIQPEKLYKRIIEVKEKFTHVG